MHLYIKKIFLLISFFLLPLIQYAQADEVSTKKCIQFSQIGLHQPAIANCQKALNEDTNQTRKDLLFSLANSYYSLNNNQLAKNTINKLFEVDRKPNADTFYLAGLIDLNLNNYSRASNLIEKSIELGKTGIDTKRQYSRALFKSGEESRAILILMGLKYETPNDIQSISQLAENYIMIGNTERAKKLINEIIEINPDYSYSYYLNHLISRLDNDDNSALASLNKAIMRDRDNTKFLTEKIKLLVSLKKFDIAKFNISILDEADKNSEIISELVNEIRNAEALDTLQKAQLNIKSKNYEEALKYYNKLISDNNSDPFLYFERGQILHILKDYRNAEIDLKKALSLNTDLESKNIYFIIGKNYYQMGNIEKSIEYIDYELRYNNSNTKALKWQIRTLFEQGNYADAELYANRLIAINPKSPDGYAILGDIKLLMGKISESNDLHSKVIEIAPNYKIATKKKLN
jgi:tetratricopeptide (TPR) repeat protein